MLTDQSPVIDAHQHFWRIADQEQPWRTDKHSAIDRDFGPKELTAELDAAGIDGTVLMQSVDEPEENVRLRHYAQHPRVAGVVGWLPLRSGVAALADLDRVEIPKLSGVRCLIARDPLDWLTDEPTLALFREVASRDLAWDVVPITDDQVRSILSLAHLVPELKIIVDHLGRPPIDSGGWEPWAGFAAELADAPNVSMKVSVGIDVLTASRSWDSAGLERYVTHVCGLFGASRLMLASNWPVVLLRASYADAWSDLSRLVGAVFPDKDDRALLFGGTAIRTYGLEGARLPEPTD